MSIIFLARLNTPYGGDFTNRRLIQRRRSSSFHVIQCSYCFFGFRNVLLFCGIATVSLRSCLNFIVLKFVDSVSLNCSRRDYSLCYINIYHQVTFVRCMSSFFHRIQKSLSTQRINSGSLMLETVFFIKFYMSNSFCCFVPGPFVLSSALLLL